MKKRLIGFRLALLLFFALALVSGCGRTRDDGAYNKGKNEIQTIADDRIKLYCIEMTVVSPNESHVYAAKYPFHYYYVDRETHRCRLIDMRNTPSKIISKEDFDVFADYIERVNERNKSNGKTGEKKSQEQPDVESMNAGYPKDDIFTYSIYVSYLDCDNEQSSLYCSEKGVFPEELNVVIDKFNELCQEKILTYPSERVESEVDFILEEFGYTQEDYPKQDVEAMLDSPYVNMAKLVSSTNTLAGYMKDYYTSLELVKIEDLMPDGTEVGEDVSMEELYAFARDFASILGKEWKVSESTVSSSLYELRCEKKEPLLLGRVIDIPSFSPDLQNPSIFIMVGPEGEGYSSSYVIDSTGNYFLAKYMEQEDFVEIVKLFVGK